VAARSETALITISGERYSLFQNQLANTRILRLWGHMIKVVAYRGEPEYAYNTLKRQLDKFVGLPEGGSVGLPDKPLRRPQSAKLSREHCTQNGLASGIDSRNLITQH